MESSVTNLKTKPSTLNTKIADSDDARIRIEVEVSAQEFQRRLDPAARRLSQHLRIPGFRSGKVPAQLVIGRVGWAAVAEEVVREQLPRWCSESLSEVDENVVGDPKVEIVTFPEQADQLLEFSIELWRAPKAKLGDYAALEVPHEGVDVDKAEVESELESLQQRFARLDDVDEPAEANDMVIVDYHGEMVDTEGGITESPGGNDEMLELGSGKLVPEVETALIGSCAGDEHDVTVNFTGDDVDPKLVGNTAKLHFHVKGVKRKRLPELDDEFALEAGFGTLKELREDIQKHLQERLQTQADARFREAVVDAVSGQAELDLPQGLIDERTATSIRRVESDLAQRKIDKAMYLQMMSKTEAEFEEEIAKDVERSLRRSATLEAIIDQQQFEVADEEVDEFLEPLAKREKTTLQKLRKQITKDGRLTDLRRDLLAQKAVDHCIETVKKIPATKAHTSEKLWTPEADDKDSGKKEKLWTPES